MLNGSRFSCPFLRLHYICGGGFYAQTTRFAIISMFMRRPQDPFPRTRECGWMGMNVGISYAGIITEIPIAYEDTWIYSLKA